MTNRHDNDKKNRICVYLFKFVLIFTDNIRVNRVWIWVFSDNQKSDTGISMR